ncbi:CdaR family protein, partial [Paenibacillus sp.]|uniref:CdaR family protein n=1 Tax=Paenibacillus sp. TaxID=58172 RepID=UPI002D61FEF4
FTAGEPVAQPNRVNVTVSSSLADQVASVVGLIDIDGATESVKQQVKLVALDQEGTELDVAVTPAVVDVEVPVTSPFKTVPLQVTLEGETPPGFAVGAFEQSASEVTVFAPQAFLNSLEFYDGLRIDLGALSATRTFEFDVPLKDGVERVDPGKVTARVTIVPAVNATLTGIPLTLNGKQEDYEYRVVAPELGAVDVTVEAAQDVIDNLAAEDVRAIVDVSNLPPGVHELPVEYTLPSFVEPSQTSVGTVTVEVTAVSEETTADPAAPDGEGPAAGTGNGTGTEDGGKAGADEDAAANAGNGDDGEA